MLEHIEGTVIEKGEWKPLYGGAEGRDSSNKEIKRRSLYGGTLGGSKFN